MTALAFCQLYIMYNRQTRYTPHPSASKEMAENTQGGTHKHSFTNRNITACLMVRASCEMLLRGTNLLALSIIVNFFAPILFFHLLAAFAGRLRFLII